MRMTTVWGYVRLRMWTKMIELCPTKSLCRWASAKTVRTERPKITISGSYLLANMVLLTEVVDVLGAISLDIPMSTNMSTGYHVHIGVGLTNREFTLEEVRKIAIITAVYEGNTHPLHNQVVDDHLFQQNPLTSYMGLIVPLKRLVTCFTWIAQTSSSNFKHIKDSELVPTIMSIKSVEDLTHIMNPSLSAWLSDDGFPEGTMWEYKVNFVSLKKHWTIEFWQHKGTINPKKICTWAELLLALVHRAMDVSNKDLIALDPTVIQFTQGLSVTVL